MISKKALTLSAALLVGGTLALPGVASAQNIDAETLRQMQELIQAQAEQLKLQQEQMKAIQAKMEVLQIMAEDASNSATEAKLSIQEQLDLPDPTVAREAASDESPGITSGNKNVELSITGHINRMVNVANDGEETTVLHVDNSASQSRIRFVGAGKIDEDKNVGTVIELGLSNNPSSKVNQINETQAFDVTGRKIEAYLRSKKFGAVWLGQGSSASDSTAEYDLSHSGVIGYSSVSDFGGGMLFREDDGTLSSVSVSSVFSNFDGLGRLSRVRYDTPTYYGVRGSASAGENGQWDMALTAGGETSGFDIAAAVAYSKPENVNNRISSSASIKHMDTGISLSGSYGRDSEDQSGVSDPNFWYLKAGWDAKLWDIGDTSFAVDYSNVEHVGGSSNKSKSWALYGVQHFTDYGTEFYVGYRNYSLDSVGANYQDIGVGSMGARVKF